VVTVHREGGMRFVIYLDDHDPAHLHVYGDGEARIDILNVRVLSVRGMSKRDVARALFVVGKRQQQFMQRWLDIHG
jgi:hypothetical protein